MKTYGLVCKNCGKVYTSKLARGVYCSGKCRQAAYNERKRAAKKGKGGNVRS